MDDAIQIRREVCLLAEYAVNMKSVIPDYDWTIFGVRVNQPTLQTDGCIGDGPNLLIVFYVQIMPDDFVMQLHRF
ncbi:hypothetical protein KVR801_140043 [Klebsiella variicola]|nr:hypothetical protein KVR801_140043 [Klebsiella variicola]